MSVFENAKIAQTFPTSLTLNSVATDTCHYTRNPAVLVIFNIRAGVFYRGIKPRDEAEWL